MEAVRVLVVKVEQEEGSFGIFISYVSLTITSSNQLPTLNSNTITRGFGGVGGRGGNGGGGGAGGLGGNGGLAVYSTQFALFRPEMVELVVEEGMAVQVQVEMAE